MNLNRPPEPGPRMKAAWDDHLSPLQGYLPCVRVISQSEGQKSLAPYGVGGVRVESFGHIVVPN